MLKKMHMKILKSLKKTICLCYFYKHLPTKMKRGGGGGEKIVEERTKAFL